ncbi:MAG: nucleoside hydrolase [Acidimicrobiales bacterium]
MARPRVVIDTDPGVDDAVAILLALASPEIDVVALTTVAGNVSLDKTTLNARRLLHLARRRDVTVAAGCAQPLAGPSGDAREVHGNDGLSDLTWDEPEVVLSREHAVDLLARLIDEAPLTIVAIGPLTNLATLLDRYGGIERRVERVVLMGGASFEGNVTPAAEFNVWADPEAADRVLAAGWPVTVMPLDLTHQAYLVDDDIQFMRGLQSDVGQRLADILEPHARVHEARHGNRHLYMHDSMAIYEVIDPSAIEKQGVSIRVETDGRHSRGATWIDRRPMHQDSRVQVGTTVDNRAFVTLLRERLVSYGAAAPPPQRAVG